MDVLPEITSEIISRIRKYIPLESFPRPLSETPLISKYPSRFLQELLSIPLGISAIFLPGILAVGVYYLKKPGKPGIIREFYSTWKNLEFSGNFGHNQGNYFELVVPANFVLSLSRLLENVKNSPIQN